jgi:hypothetical protein
MKKRNSKPRKSALGVLLEAVLLGKSPPPAPDPAAVDRQHVRQSKAEVADCLRNGLTAARRLGELIDSPDEGVSLEACGAVLDLVAQLRGLALAERLEALRQKGEELKRTACGPAPATTTNGAAP